MSENVPRRFKSVDARLALSAKHHQRGVQQSKAKASGQTVHREDNITERLPSHYLTAEVGATGRNNIIKQALHVYLRSSKIRNTAGISQWCGDRLTTTPTTKDMRNNNQGMSWPPWRPNDEASYKRQGDYLSFLPLFYFFCPGLLKMEAPW